MNQLNSSATNMRIEQISPGQLYCGVMLFVFGTAWFWIPGASQGRDSWIAALLGLGTGLLFALLYLRLAALFPGEQLAEWLPRLCGPVIGRLLTGIYCLYFLYISARDLRDIAELLRLNFLLRTPMVATLLLVSALVALAGYHGVEVSIRVKQMLLPITLILLAVACFGIYSRRYPIHLHPILEHGLMPVWHDAFPVAVTVPYGELVILLFLVPFCHGRPKVAVHAAVLTAGGILVLLTYLCLLVIGPGNLATSTLPFYSVVRSINLGDVIQRIDALVVPLLAFAAFAKAGTWLNATAYNLARLMGAARPFHLAVFLSLVAAAWASMMARSLDHHLQIGLQLVPYALHIPLQIVVPLLLWLLAELRNRFRPLKRQPQGPKREAPPRWSLTATAIVALLLWILAYNPAWKERSRLAERLMPPLGRWIGSPVAQLLGGRAMDPKQAP